MRYIDFDGVILDTEDPLFRKWRENPEHSKMPEECKIKYMQEIDWKKVLYESEVMGDALYILKHSDIKDNVILTKVHSLNNEGYNKILYLRNKGIKNNIILVPYQFKKSDIVIAKNNILIDDSLKNLTEWVEAGGISQFFDYDDDNIDTWGVYNSYGYQKVKTINESINHIIK